MLKPTQLTPNEQVHRGLIDYLGTLATVRLYRNDRQIKQVSCREIEAD